MIPNLLCGKIWDGWWTGVWAKFWICWPLIWPPNDTWDVTRPPQWKFKTAYGWFPGNRGGVTTMAAVWTPPNCCNSGCTWSWGENIHSGQPDTSCNFTSFSRYSKKKLPPPKARKQHQNGCLTHKSTPQYGLGMSAAKRRITPRFKVSCEQGFS